MLVAVGRIVLDFYNNVDVKVKRHQLEQVCDDLKRKFNISVMEVADFDDPERCVLGFSAVIPENWKTVSAHNLIEKICKTIDQTSVARVMSEDCDLIGFGD